MLIAIAISLLLVFVMSGRDADDQPRAKSPAEVRDSIKRTGWLRCAVHSLWFLLAFTVNLAAGVGWVLVFLLRGVTWLLQRAGSGLYDLGNAPALSA